MSIFPDVIPVAAGMTKSERMLKQVQHDAT
jgi:hypothetical protein